ncbi:MAG TPA: hypothetical protein VHO72_09870 [Bacteroidales bacterium]|nr:hypothetical protein [Bacteroidales bacterium]
MSIFRFEIRVFILFICTFQAYSQDNSIFKAYEDSVKRYIEEVKKSNDDSLKIQYNQHIYNLFSEILLKPESFTFGFDSLKTMGKLVAPDQLFRIFTWNVALSDGSYKYYGIIQLRNEAGNKIRLYNLSDRAPEIENPENNVLSAGKWYGALYYKVLKNKVDNYTFYTLLGLRYHDFFTTAKLVDVLYFDQFDNPVFGAPLFLVDSKKKHRLLFQFSARATMNLSYNESLKMIVFDHLSPSESKYTGQYMYYGPDFSSDGLLFKNKMWNYQTDIIKYTKPQPRPLKKSNKLH